MRKTTLKNAKQLLLDMKRQILREISDELKHGREGAKDDGMDTYDLASEERDREINFILSDREREKLQSIEEALGAHRGRQLRHLRELRGRDRAGAARGDAVQPPVRELPGRAREGSEAAASFRRRAGLPPAGHRRRRRRELLNTQLRRRAAPSTSGRRARLRARAGSPADLQRRGGGGRSGGLVQRMAARGIRSQLAAAARWSSEPAKRRPGWRQAARPRSAPSSVSGLVIVAGWLRCAARVDRRSRSPAIRCPIDAGVAATAELCRTW